MNEHDELVAIQRCLAGDSRGFNEVAKKYLKPIYNLALRMVQDSDLAADIVQSTFIKAFERLHTFDQKQRFFSWLYRIAIHESINALERNKSTVSYSEEPVSKEPSPSDNLLHRERDEAIQSALMKLPADQRAVVVLRHFMDFSYGDLAEMLLIPEKTVKSRLFSARERLKELLHTNRFL
jgi:RNA polymerase sigma-70 factor (ECF subfamily)